MPRVLVAHGKLKHHSHPARSPGGLTLRHPGRHEGVAGTESKADGGNRGLEKECMFALRLGSGRALEPGRSRTPQKVVA